MQSGRNLVELLSMLNSLLPRARRPFLYLFAVPLLALCASAAGHAQSPSPESGSPGSGNASQINVPQLVKDASWNELHASSNGVTYRYRKHLIDDGKETTREVVETNEGDVWRLLATGGQPLSAAANQKELDRLNRLLANPSIQANRYKQDQQNSDRQNEMLRLLPTAFLYKYVGMVAGPNGPCYRLTFSPNPSFDPPDRQAQVYHGMAGELWIDQAQKRLVRFDAHLIADVDFGWGIAGRLNQGGTIQVQQRDVGDRHWESTYLRLNLTGKILLFKSLIIDSTEEDSEFNRVPNDGYKAAVVLLKGMPVR